MIPLVLADIGDIIQIVVIVIVVSFSVISKLIMQVQANREAQRQAERRRRLPQPSPSVAQQVPRTPVDGERRNFTETTETNPLQAEFDTFLRKARGEYPRPELPPAEIHHSGQGTPKRPPPPIRPGEGFGSSVTSLSGENISSRPAPLSAATDQADERVEQHLRDVFVHEVGRLVHTTSAGEAELVAIAEGTDAKLGTAQSTGTSPTKWVERLRSPSNVRDAIVAAEILKRPDF